MTARAQRVVAALLSANGEPMSADQIAAQAGVEKVTTAIKEARDELGAPIETCLPKGTGYRLPQGWAPDQPLKQAAPRPAEGVLTERGAKMLAALEAAGGAWVSGKALADPLGAFPSDLGPIAKHIMRKRPGLIVEGQRGRGYRLAVDGGRQLPLPAATLVTETPPKLPPAPLPKHQSHRTAIELLAALSPRIAERVRDIALETGTTADRAMERLLEYGIEVHRDLIVHGEHPMLLGKAA